MKKFELTAEFVTNVFGKKLFRIKALVAFGDVEKGELGGFIEKEDNLSHDGNAWVSGNAWVYGDARVYGDAHVSGNARVYGDAHVSGNAHVSDNAWVSGNAHVSDNAWVSGNAHVSGDARVSGDADYAVVIGFGRCFRTTTFFRCKDKILRVQCGCFYGDLAQFREIVKKTHGDSKYAKEYLAIADLMELHFSDEC
nr:MAG TPA: Putative transferase, nesg, ydcK, Structural Genomics.38A [Caudoviricetes sp.]